MDIAKSDIVQSDAGRDKGKLFYVLAVEGEFLLLADGKSRRVEAPKRKKRRHVLFVSAEETRLSPEIPYEEISGLRLEARQKLDRQKPVSLGAAGRIPGVNPADVAVLQVWLHKQKEMNKE